VTEVGPKPGGTPLRIGAVSYLNSRPLIVALPALAPHARIETDLPSRLADRLAAADLDVALIPSVEYFRLPGSRIVSDVCIACEGPVRSVKLYGRVPPEAIRTLALDEGSRTSAALVRILLNDRYGLEPAFVRLPIGQTLETSEADATMLIGDRGMLPTNGDFAFVWDLGELWLQWTGLPFVFAMWVARPGIEVAGLDTLLSAARNEGLRQLPAIAAHDGPRIGIAEADCLSYLQENLRFSLGARQKAGLRRFYELACRHGLAPEGIDLGSR